MCKSHPTNLLEAVRYFADEDTCFDFVKRMRWPDKVTCPLCGGHDHSFLTTRKMWQCKSCNKQFSVKKGTIFEGSPIKLDKWLIAMWLIANAKNGISSYELHRSIGVTQKTAWFILHRIRLAMQNGSMEKLEGDIEIDETYYGGKAKNMHKLQRLDRIIGRGPADKTAIVGMLQRGEEIRTEVIQSPKKKVLHSLIGEHVAPGSNIYTDSLPSYEGLPTHYVHGAVDHSAEYVKGDAHTNGLECFWSLLKRSIAGTYSSVEPIHMFRYLDEYTFRYNERKANDAERFALLATMISGKRLTYANLTGKVGAA